MSTVLALAKGLGIGAGDLLGASPYQLSSTAVEVAKLFDTAGDEIQSAVATILRATARRRAR